MYRSGHMGIGFIFSIPAIFYLQLIQVKYFIPIFLALFSIMSVHPDIDIYLQEITKGRIEHRGKTHTLLYGVLWGVILGVLLSVITYFIFPNAYFEVDLPNYPILNSIIIGFYIGFIGISSHIAGDVITPSGVSFLKPFKHKNYSLNYVYARNFFANLGFLISGSLMLIFISLYIGVLKYVLFGLGLSLMLQWDKISDLDTWKYQLDKTVSSYISGEFTIKTNNKRTQIIIDFEDGRKNNIYLKPGDFIYGESEDHKFKGKIGHLEEKNKIFGKKYYVVFNKSKILYKKSKDIERRKNYKVKAHKIAKKLDSGEYKKKD